MPGGVNNITYHYDSTGQRNQLDSLTGFATNSYTYDPSGNIASDSVKKASFYYDIYGQLNLITFPRHGFDAGDSILYGYSNSGQRVYKIYINNYTDTCGGEGTPRGGGDFGTRDIKPPPLPCPYRDTAVTVYVRGKDGKVLAQWGVAGAKYVYAGDQRIAMYKSGNLYFYFNDHLGSARVVVKASNGTVVDKYYTSSFGAPTGQTVSLNQRYRYTGKPFDEDGGIDLYYYGARYYDPLLGRFLAIDPLARKYPDWSPYVYCLNNPLKYVDPKGESVKLPERPVSENETAFESFVLDVVWGIITDPVPSTGSVTGVGRGLAKATAKASAKATAKAAATTTGETAATKAGRKAHGEFKQKVKAKEGWKPDPRLKDPETGKTVIPDAISPSGKPVELKPNTPSGRKSGKTQLKKYEKVTKKKGRVVYYDPTKYKE